MNIQTRETNTMNQTDQIEIEQPTTQTEPLADLPLTGEQEETTTAGAGGSGGGAGKVIFQDIHFTTR
jgi:hypothetical protein